MSAPATSFLGQLVEGFAQLLAAESIGLTYNASGVYTADQTGIVAMAVPDKPNRIVVLTPYPLGDDPSLSNSTVGLQVRSRSAGQDPRDVFTLDDSIADALLGRFPLTLPTGVRVNTLVRTSATSMGMDDSQRWGWSSNYRLTVYRPGAHRL